MTQPTCEHTSPAGWEPRTKTRWQNASGTWREHSRCPAFLLHSGLQCTQPGRGDFPHFCRFHSRPTEIARNKRCKQCIRREVKKAEPTNQRTSLAQELSAAFSSELTPKQEVEAVRQWDLSLKQGRTNREAALALLADDLKRFDVMIRELKAGQKEAAAGNLEAGAKRIIAAVEEYGPGLDLAEIQALARPEQIPAFGRMWPRTAVGELLTRLRGLEFKFLPSGADRRAFQKEMTGGPH